MTDESQLQVRPNDGDSSLTLSTVSSGLIARGRREYSAILARLASWKAEEANKVPISEGICNKCGKHDELILAGCVCGSCSDGLDLQWANSTATDWVLVITSRETPIVLDIMAALNRRLALKQKGAELSGDCAIDTHRTASGDHNRYIYRNSAYAYMRAHWATCEPPADFCIGPATPEDVVTAGSLWANRSMLPDTPFIRPATAKEIAEHDADLGIAYYYGEGVAQDHTAAAMCFRRAAEQGHAGAQYNLGVAHHNGQGVERVSDVNYFFRSATIIFLAQRQSLLRRRETAAPGGR